MNLYQTDWGPRVQAHQGLDQNRGFVGIGYRISPEIKTEIGYMNQYIPSHSAANDRMNNIISRGCFLIFTRTNPHMNHEGSSRNRANRPTHGHEARGKGKIRTFDWKSSPLAFDPAPLVQTLVITAEVLMNIAGI